MTPLPPSVEQEACLRLDAFRSAAREAGVALPDGSDFVSQAKRLFAWSEFAARVCCRQPDLPMDLWHSGDLVRPYPSGELARRLTARLSMTDSAADPEAWVAGLERLLRRVRRREMLRIAWRDLCGTADLDTTLRELSDFAEVCVRVAAEALQRHLGTIYGAACDGRGNPQHLVVLGLGKLGARELNFSSDIDLMFAYPEAGRTEGGTDNESFFLRLCRLFLRTLSAKTAEGFVYRVDTRLRPFGENGPLVMNFEATEAYYQEQGREWERYALIKARPLTAATAGSDLLSRLHPFVYRRYLDFGAFESLRAMKEMIALEMHRRGIENNIKLGPGGIREIEFFGQMFQLIRGGVTPSLRCPGIKSVLERLAAEGHVPPLVCRELSMAYDFLRRVENRLQMFSDRQTHSLPTDADGRLRLASAMGHRGWEAFSTALEAHRRAVHGHFQRLLEPSQPQTTSAQFAAGLESTDLDALWRGILDDTRGCEVLAALGFSAPQGVLKQLEDLRDARATRELSGQGKARLDRLVPLFLHEAGGCARPDVVLQRVLDMVKTIQQRTTYLALLLENPGVRGHLLRLAGASPWIASFLARHPVLLDELLDPRTLYQPPERRELVDEIQKRLAMVDPGDLEEQIEQLCIFRQVNTLRVAAADVSGAVALMHTSDHLTEIAETILGEVVALCWSYLAARHGAPQTMPAVDPNGRGFAVIAYGKLGGIELGYGSDLDLVFIHAAAGGQTGGPGKPVDNALFYARLGQRVIHVLTAHTAAGRLYEVDMRLRPSGSGGVLVSHVDGFEAYQSEEAWTWEHQALVRARPIFGDAPLVERFQAVRREVLSQKRDPRVLRREVAEMRRRMRTEALKKAPAGFDLKQGPGGIVDIEFLVQYLVLRYAYRHPDLLVWTDNVRLLEGLMAAGVLTPRRANRLKQAYLTYRSAVHRCNLEEKAARVAETRFQELRAVVCRCWGEYLAIDG